MPMPPPAPLGISLEFSLGAGAWVSGDHLASVVLVLPHGLDFALRGDRAKLCCPREKSCSAPRPRAL